MIRWSSLRPVKSAIQLRSKPAREERRGVSKDSSAWNRRFVATRPFWQSDATAVIVVDGYGAEKGDQNSCGARSGSRRVGFSVSNFVCRSGTGSMYDECSPEAVMNGFIKVLSRSAIALAILKLSIGAAAAIPSDPLL